MEGNRAQPTDSSGRAVVSEQSSTIYWSQAHELARERLNFAVASRVPMTLFVGRPGTGRTLLVRDRISTNTTAFVIRMLKGLDNLSGEVFWDVLTVFNPKQNPTASAEQSREKLISLLQSLHAAQRFPVLVVDDADDLSNLYLGALCDLCDQLVDQRPLLKLVFVGQTGMADILSGVRPDLVGPAFTLDCMNEKDVGGYVRMRLSKMGLENRSFDKGATRELFVISNGIPAKLDAFCEALKQHGSSADPAELDKAEVRRIASLIRTPDADDRTSGDQEGLRHVPTDAELLARANHVAGILQSVSDTDNEEHVSTEPAKSKFGRKTGLALGAIALIGAGTAAYLLGVGGLSGERKEATTREAVASSVNAGGGTSVLRRLLPGTAAAAEARVERISGALAGAEPSANGQYLAALELADTAPDAAAVGYALAALSGHERSAYYLGQIYETGEGVPVDLTLARIWYNRAASGIEGAAARLEDMQSTTESGPVSVPTPLFSKKMPDGSLQLVWTSGEGADPSAYRIELSSTFSDTALYSAEVSTSALRLRPPQAARTWRVIALDQNGREVASPWMEIRLK